MIFVDGRRFSLDFFVDFQLSPLRFSIFTIDFQFSPSVFTLQPSVFTLHPSIFTFHPSMFTFHPFDFQLSPRRLSICTFDFVPCLPSVSSSCSRRSGFACLFCQAATVSRAKIEGRRCALPRGPSIKQNTKVPLILFRRPHEWRPRRWVDPVIPRSDRVEPVPETEWVRFGDRTGMRKSLAIPGADLPWFAPRTRRGRFTWIARMRAGQRVPRVPRVGIPPLGRTRMLVLKLISLRDSRRGDSRLKTQI